MKKMLAICTDAPAFLQNQILREDVAVQYPGALWAPRLLAMAKSRGMSVVTGDIAVQAIHGGTVEAKNVLIIQEDLSQYGADLRSLGAKPQSLFCLESPIFAVKFYDQLPQISSLFSHRILFRGAIPLAKGPGHNSVAHFPSFGANTFGKSIPWTQRKFLVMVAGNKYFKEERPLFRKFLSGIKDLLLNRKRESLSKEIFKTQLHDRRLELIEHFGSLEKIDLFGSNWKNLTILPAHWRNRLEKIISRLDPQKCEDKQALISNYKFSVCLENLVYPGYVTEKMIDCLYAGVIPLYQGAPDIADFVPEECFIDLRKYKNLDDLSEELSHFSEARAEKMLLAGAKFLRTAKGHKFSYEGFAEEILSQIDGSEIL